MYVCITRAKHNLHLSHCLSRVKFNNNFKTYRSRFIDEMLGDAL
jgi:superfamily I DNA/RNA helicase